MRIITGGIIFLFLTSYSCFALTGTSDSVRIEQYLKQAADFIRSTPDSSIVYIEKAKKIAHGKL